MLTPVVRGRPGTTEPLYVQHGYIDLDDREFDVVVRQSEGPEPRSGQVTTSTGVVLVVSIVVASLLLLAVIVLLVFFRYDGALLATASVDALPVGCRRYLAVCGLSPSAVTHPETATRSPPRVATSMGQDDRANCPPKSQNLSTASTVVASARTKHSRVPGNPTSRHGVIEWYV